MNRTAPVPRFARLRSPLLALGIALSSFAAAQSAPDPAAAPTNPNLGPAFATKNAAYVPVLFDEIPGWGEESFDETYASFSTNCKAMKRRSSWAPLCARLARLAKNDTALRDFMHDEFYAYQMLTPTRNATGKLTGYFEPLIAGSLRNEGAYKYPVYTTTLNIVGTANVLESARINGALRVYLASTVWVYNGCPNGREVDEATPFYLDGAGHIYTSTKMACEMICHNYAQLYHVPFTVLRLGIPYGPRMREELLIPVFIRKALAGQPLTIAGKGDQYRNFVYVRDLAETLDVELLAKPTYGSPPTALRLGIRAGG